MRTATVSGISCLAVVFAAPAFAQAPPERAVSSAVLAGSASPAPESTDIIVTANRREQSGQRVGVAVSSLGKEGIAELGRQDISALMKLLPSVQVQQLSPLTTILNIRGVSQNDTSLSQEAPIAFYADGAYVSSMGAISGQNFDLERVEVLRGPQGTLFGRNATGGLMQVFSAKPTSSVTGFATLTYGSYNQVSTEGAISGPLTEDLRARLSFTSQNGGAYVKNANGPDLGGQKFIGGRLQIAGPEGGPDQFNLKLQVLHDYGSRNGGLYTWGPAAPNARGLGVPLGPNELGNFLAADGSTFTTCPGCDALGYKGDTRPNHTSVDHLPLFKRTVLSATFAYSHDFGDIKLDSISDYQNVKRFYTDDQDLSPANVFYIDNLQHFYQYSQELRLSGDIDKFKWIVGAYGIKIHSRDEYLANIVPTASRYRDTLDTESLAGFGQVEFRPSTLFAIIGGLRYTVDWKRFNYSNSTDGLPIYNFNTTLYPTLAKKRFGDYSGKLELDFTPTPNILVYASINRGTKSGGFNTPAIPAAPPAPAFDATAIPFGREVLTSYEGGVKTTFLNGAARFNATAFYYKYDGYQSYSAVGVSLYIRNQNARLYGLEFDLNLRPVRGLNLAMFGTFEHTKVMNVILPFGDVATTKMPQAPEVSLGGSVNYSVDLEVGTFSASTNWKYNSSQYFTAFNAPVDREKSYVVGDARLAFAPKNTPIELAVFVNNITDRAYRVFSYDFSTVFGFSESVYARPRWFGGSLTVRLR